MPTPTGSPPRFPRWLLLLLVPLLAGAVGLVQVLLGSTMSFVRPPSDCGTTQPYDANTSVTTPEAGGSINAQQVANMKAIAQTVESLHAGPYVTLVAATAAVGESDVLVLDYGDRAGPDSRGLFQQRDNWGPLKWRMDPVRSTKLFLLGPHLGGGGLLDVTGGPSLSISHWIHASQRNADPEHYTQFVGRAKQIAAQAGVDFSTSPADTGAGGAAVDPAAAAAATGADVPGCCTAGDGDAGGAEPTSPTGSVTVTSFNIMTGRKTAHALGFPVPATDVTWEARQPQVVAWLRQANPDVAGLQENESDGHGGRQSDHLAPILSEYGWAEPDTNVPILYRRSMFTLVRSGIFPISWKGRDSSRFDRFASWALLRTAGGQQLLEVNTHTHPYQNAQAARARSASYDRLTAGIRRINPGLAVPFTLTGDFNAANTDTRPTYRDAPLKLRTVGLTDAYSTATRNTTAVKNAASYGGYGITIAGKWRYRAVRTYDYHFDYVWISKGITARTWQVETGPGVHTRTIAGTEYPFLADKPVPSDHDPVTAALTIGTPDPAALTALTKTDPVNASAAAAAATSSVCDAGTLPVGSGGCPLDDIVNPAWKPHRDCNDALEWEKAQMQSKTTAWPGLCLMLVQHAYGISGGAPTAYDAAMDAKAAGKLSTDRTRIPRGAILYWDGHATGNSAGHVALYDGNGHIWTNDAGVSGAVTLVAWDMPEKVWGQKFLGWAPPYFKPPYR